VKELANAPGFKKLQTDFLSYGMTIPVMLTEYGCLSKSFPTVNEYEAQRTWLQAGWLYSSDFRNIFSGGFVFEYSTENANSNSTSPYPFKKFGAQNYGLGYFSPETCNHGTIPCVYNPMPNFNNLAGQYKAINVSGESNMDAFTSDRTTQPACPAMFSALAASKWAADGLASLPCPTAVQSYTCANQLSSGIWVTGSGSGTTGTDSGSGSASTSTTTTNGGSTRHASLVGSAVSATLISAILSVIF